MLERLNQNVVLCGLFWKWSSMMIDAGDGPDEILTDLAHPR